MAASSDSSSASRVFPMAGSPRQSTSDARPPSACSRYSASALSSLSRPTKAPTGVILSLALTADSGSNECRKQARLESLACPRPGWRSHASPPGKRQQRSVTTRGANTPRDGGASDPDTAATTPRRRTPWSSPSSPAVAALGFWGALREVFPATREQRCWVHVTANVLDALPKRLHPEAIVALAAIYGAEAGTPPSGLRSLASGLSKWSLPALPRSTARV